MDVPSPDEKSVITYVSSIYDAPSLKSLRVEKDQCYGKGTFSLKYLLALIALGGVY